MPNIYALRVVKFEQPASWRWRHNRVNVVIVKINQLEYIKHKLQQGLSVESTWPLAFFFHPLRPNKMIANVHWAKMGVMPSQYEKVRAEAIRICSRLEKRGNIIEWGVYRPPTKERTNR